MSSANKSGKLVVDIEIKASADKFFKFTMQNLFQISNITPDKVVSCELLEGDWGKQGSVILWNYVLDGNARVGKELIEATDSEKNWATLKVIEGDILQYYKSLKSTFEATPKSKGDDEEGSCVHCSLEYEKQNDKVPEPHAKLQFLVGVLSDIDAHMTSRRIDHE